jgi:hypothetical protein
MVDEREKHGERDAARSAGRQSEGGERAQVCFSYFYGRMCRVCVDLLVNGRVE